MHIRETLSPQEFEHALRAKGAYYHIHHPYHIAMHNGEASREQIQGWVANRFYYQTTIPLKDAAIMANCPDPHTRRKWVQRILDHDGSNGHDGGIEAWLQLGEAVGLSRDDLISERHVLPGVRFAVEAYVNFPPRQLAGGGMQFAHRTVCPANSSVASRQLAAALSVDQRGRLFLFPQPPQPGQPRR